MNKLKQIDEALLNLLTFVFLYPDFENRPQTKIASLSTLMAVEVTLFAVLLESDWLTVIALPFWLKVFYEWRLWLRLRNRDHQL